MFEWKRQPRLNLGVNYRDLVASRSSIPGEAMDALNTLPREDGAIYKTTGWERVNDTALQGTPRQMAGFTYRGKNTAPGDVRPGNLGLPDDGADFTRRRSEYPGYLLLTDLNSYVWDPNTDTFISVHSTLPPEITAINVPSKPTIEVVQENCYIVGWANRNLRFDPVDQVFYLWGWEEVASGPAVSLQGGGELIQNSLYQYGVSFQDIYTGEESKMSPLVSIETDETNRTVNIDTSAAVYAGSRHFNSTPGGVSSDVATVIWRTGASDNSPRFLAVLPPGVITLVDGGLARETSLRPYRSVQVDEPNFSSLKVFKGRFYALSSEVASNTVYFSHFDKASYFERWRPLDKRDFEVPDGDVLTAMGGTDTTLLVYAQRGCFRISISVSVTQIQVNGQALPWHVGAVGPQARLTVDGWEYFLSERGPYRWREGMTSPDPIGENLLPLFTDPASGLCKLNAAAMVLSDVSYDWESNTVRFMFALGSEEFLVNTHMAYWVDADKYTGDAHKAWWPQSTEMQAMDLTSALTRSVIPPRTEKQKLVWADKDGYVYEYLPNSKRAGLGPLEVALTSVDSVISANTIQVNSSGLFTDGDGMKGLRLEIASAPDPVSGISTCEVYEIASNTSDQITATVDFTRTPVAGDDVRLAGIQAFWRSVYDDFELAHQHKTIMDFSLGYQDRFNAEGSITVSVGAGERPTTFSRQTLAVMDKYRKKFTLSRTGVWFMYEFSNSIPDEMFLITDFEREVEAVPARRRTS